MCIKLNHLVASYLTRILNIDGDLKEPPDGTDCALVFIAPSEKVV